MVAVRCRRRRSSSSDAECCNPRVQSRQHAANAPTSFKSVLHPSHSWQQTSWQADILLLIPQAALCLTPSVTVINTFPSFNNGVYSILLTPVVGCPAPTVGAL